MYFLRRALFINCSGVTSIYIFWLGSGTRYIWLLRRSHRSGRRVSHSSIGGRGGVAREKNTNNENIWNSISEISQVCSSTHHLMYHVMMLLVNRILSFKSSACLICLMLKLPLLDLIMMSSRTLRTVHWSSTLLLTCWAWAWQWRAWLGTRHGIEMCSIYMQIPMLDSLSL